MLEPPQPQRKLVIHQQEDEPRHLCIKTMHQDIYDFIRPKLDQFGKAKDVNATMIELINFLAEMADDDDFKELASAMENEDDDGMFHVHLAINEFHEPDAVIFYLQESWELQQKTVDKWMDNAIGGEENE